MSKWQRYKFMPLIPLGEDGRIVTGSREHIALSRQIASEGMVLLKNENHTLPLAKGSKVALFGKGSADYVKGGGGSGDVTVAYVRNLCDGMEEKQAEGKLTTFLPLHEFYRENVKEQYAAKTQPGKTVEPEIPGQLLQEAANQCDTAIISICRWSSEGGDRTGEPNDGNFYLSLAEQKMIEDVCGAFQRIVVVLNVGGMVDTSWFVSNPKIQAVLLAWQGGQEGGLAEADVLCGDVNPSGKLTDTFAGSFDDYPSSYNFNESEDYVCYTDDIFVGYRYFETIPGAAQKVNYPFGFGLSYTTFSMEEMAAEDNGDTITVTVTVTNTGTMPGKEVVQLYSSALGGDLELPKYQLRGFQKTKLLTPGACQILQLVVNKQELAFYDETKAAWVLPAAQYEIYVGNSVRNLQKAYDFTQTREQVVFQTVNRCQPRKLPRRLHADGSYEDLKTCDYPALYNTAHWPEKPKWSKEHILPNMAGTEMPAGRISFEKVASGEVTMDAFMEQLTTEEMITLLGGSPNRGPADTSGIGGLDYIGIPAVMTADGPAGLRFWPERGICTTAWPVATALACTWDTELVYQVGVAAAKEVKENNMGMWLAPAINIHRSPLCGRNFEYYSEDPYISGKLAAAMIRGVQSQSISACVKHFCVNNKETNRCLSDSRVSERALREIYLKAFEIVVKESDVWCVMTAYNLLNGHYTSEKDELINGILRQEWGYEGLVVTDWENQAEQYREALAGNDVRMPCGSFKRLQKALELGLITRNDLAVNVRRVLQWILKLD
ncbi:MAG: glycoside hydrolase family 3 C-terminal domain-containing protein [Oscillospiraceae bacterium]|nr:glycoside hydrolase family 3 C-terminal domain-containing protein [Oscillospiraceae bacterium]